MLRQLTSKLEHIYIQIPVFIFVDPETGSRIFTRKRRQEGCVQETGVDNSTAPKTLEEGRGPPSGGKRKRITLSRTACTCWLASPAHDNVYGTQARGGV